MIRMMVTFAAVGEEPKCHTLEIECHRKRNGVRGGEELSAKVRVIGYGAGVSSLVNRIICAFFVPLEKASVPGGAPVYYIRITPRGTQSSNICTISACNMIYREKR